MFSSSPSYKAEKNRSSNSLFFFNWYSGGEVQERSKIADDEDVETEMGKWLRQQSKVFYAVGFDALVKRWNKCIHVGGGYVEK
jgi:hypothetical protein